MVSTLLSTPRSTEILQQKLASVAINADKMFRWVLISQWALAIVFALFVSPYTWIGKVHTINVHVQVAFFVGGIINALPLYLIWKCPGQFVTRCTVAVAQLCWSALLIHLTGGRVETHFHVFVSLAFLAFYRDWRVLVPATLAVVIDHLARGIFWPESVYGIAEVQIFRFLEHAGWVVFEDIVLVIGCVKSVIEMDANARQEAYVEEIRSQIEAEVERKTKELTSSIQTQEDLRFELIQAQKLEAIGRLASGIAHEINTPIQFVTDSLYFIKDSFADLFLYTSKVDEFAKDASPEFRAQLERAKEEIQLDYLETNLPPALERSSDGLARVAQIVRSMKEFAHPDQREMSLTDINHAIENTLIVARHQYKYVAEVVQDLGDLPSVLCHPGEISQVFINLIVNAAHAIEDKVAGTEDKGTITIRTALDGEFVVVEIADTGTGIPEEVKDKLFDPFFTTKEMGRGTGQGLAIARNIIAKKLGGTITVESEWGVGTTFTLRVPINAKQGLAA
ncbi:MAG: ATP-binding protein [bacterium]